MKLTDLELCKAIADIEGVKINEVHGLLLPANLGGRATYADRYTPITDKALLFDLMVKHKVTVDFWSDEDGHEGVCFIENSDCEREWSVDFELRLDIPRAILECIVEANK